MGHQEYLPGQRDIEDAITQSGETLPDPDHGVEPRFQGACKTQVLRKSSNHLREKPPSSATHAWPALVCCVEGRSEEWAKYPLISRSSIQVHACVVIQAGQAFFLDHTSTVQHRCPSGGLGRIQSLCMDTTEPYSGSISLFIVV